MCLPVSTSHSRTVRSALPEASVFPLGLNTTLLIPSVCPRKGSYVFAHFRIPQSHCAVLTAASDCASIGTERYAGDPTRMSGEGSYVFAHFRVP